MDAAECIGGRRRRNWTGGQKRQIVAESMGPGASAAQVARRHGIARGQLYAWRQQLVLSGALGTSEESTPRPSAASPAPSAGVKPATPEAGIGAGGDMLTAAVNVFAGEDAATADASGEPSLSIFTRFGQTDRPVDAVSPAGRLRRLGQGSFIGWPPVPGQQLCELVLPGATADEALQHVGKPGERLDTVQLRRGDQGHGDGPVLGRAVAAGEQRVLSVMRRYA
jgi:transposase-like protein